VTETLTLFAELKRRNAFRAAAFYAARAWLLVQVATQVLPFFHVPEWLVRAIVVSMVNARAGDNLPRAIAKLEQVTTLDPKCFHAWSKLAVAHAVLPQHVSGDWAENLTTADGYLNFLWQPDAWSRKARQSPAFRASPSALVWLITGNKTAGRSCARRPRKKGPDSFTCR
jgi:hypothetical protein